MSERRPLIARLPWLKSLARRLLGPSPGGASEEVKSRLGLGVDYVYCAGVAGDVAEFGTYSGETALVIARAMAHWELRGSPSSRRLLLFDSFRGFPEPDSPVDADCPHVKEGEWRRGTCAGISRPELADLLSWHVPNLRTDFFEGWYKDTVPGLPPEARLAMVHLDCDLYQSTWDALDPLFSRGQVSEGAALFFDAWNCNRASPRFGQRRAWAELAEKHAIAASDGGDYSWEGHKFTVHGYRGAQ